MKILVDGIRTKLNHVRLFRGGEASQAQDTHVSSAAVAMSAAQHAQHALAPGLHTSALPLNPSMRQRLAEKGFHSAADFAGVSVNDLAQGLRRYLGCSRSGASACRRILRCFSVQGLKYRWRTPAPCTLR